MIKIAIVGPEESKWKPRQKEKVKSEIKHILAKNSELVQGTFCCYGSCSNITIISGRCPISICDNCGRKSYSSNDDPIVGYVNCEFCGKKKKRRAGGVDIWAEEIADELGIKKEIYPAEVNQWNDKNIIGRTGMCDSEGLQKTLKGYRSRNIQIAEACDVLYCLVPFRYTSPNYEDVKFNNDLRCIHCKKSRHPTNGGCWTMKCAKKLGKEVHLVVIE